MEEQYACVGAGKSMLFPLRSPADEAWAGEISGFRFPDLGSKVIVQRCLEL